jgi:hypothetical protein
MGGCEKLHAQVVRQPRFYTSITGRNRALEAPTVIWGFPANHVQGVVWPVENLSLLTKIAMKSSKTNDCH